MGNVEQRGHAEGCEADARLRISKSKQPILPQDKQLVERIGVPLLDFCDGSFDFDLANPPFIDVQIDDQPRPAAVPFRFASDRLFKRAWDSVGPLDPVFDRIT
jgi:hypothetical protein